MNSGILTNVLNSSYEQSPPYRKRRGRNNFMTYLGEAYGVTHTSYGPEIFYRTSLKGDHSLISNFLKKRQPFILNDPRAEFDRTLLSSEKIPVLKAGTSLRDNTFFLNSQLNRSIIQPLIISRLQDTFNTLKLVLLIKKRSYLGTYGSLAVFVPSLLNFGSRKDPVFGVTLGSSEKRFGRPARFKLSSLFLPSHIFERKEGLVSTAFQFSNVSFKSTQSVKVLKDTDVSLATSGFRSLISPLNAMPKRSRNNRAMVTDFYKTWFSWETFMTKLLFQRWARAYTEPADFAPFFITGINLELKLQRLLTVKKVFSGGFVKPVLEFSRDSESNAYLEAMRYFDNKFKVQKKAGFYDRSFEDRKYFLNRKLIRYQKKFGKYNDSSMDLKVGGVDQKNRDKFLNRKDNRTRATSFDSKFNNKYNRHLKKFHTSRKKPWEKKNRHRFPKFNPTASKSAKSKKKKKKGLYACWTNADIETIEELAKKFEAQKDEVDSYITKSVRPSPVKILDYYKDRKKYSEDLESIWLKRCEGSKKLQKFNRYQAPQLNPFSFLQGIRPGMPPKMRDVLYSKEKFNPNRSKFLADILWKLRTQGEYTDLSELPKVAKFLNVRNSDLSLDKFLEESALHFPGFRKLRSAVLNSFNRLHLPFLRPFFYDYLIRINVAYFLLKSGRKRRVLATLFLDIFNGLGSVFNSFVKFPSLIMKSFLLCYSYSGRTDLSSLSARSQFKPFQIFPSMGKALLNRLTRTNVASYFLQKNYKSGRRFFPKYNFGASRIGKFRSNSRNWGKFYGRLEVFENMYRFDYQRFKERELGRLFTPFAIKFYPDVFTGSAIFKSPLQYRLLLIRLMFVKLHLASTRPELKAILESPLNSFSSIFAREIGVSDINFFRRSFVALSR